MKTRTAIGVGLAALGVVAATSAHAQTVPGSPPGAEAPPMAQPGLAPREVLRVVRASGLTPLTQPARRGQHYMVLASDNMGGQLRVVIGAFDGRIVHAAPARDPRFAAYPVRPRGYVPITPQYGAGPGTQYGAPPARGMAPPPDLREPSAPLPRAAARAPVPRPPANTPQDPRLASAPDVTGSVPTRPTRTPLPRPRPAAAANEATSQTTPAAPAAAVAATAPAPAASAEPPAANPPAAAPKPAPSKPTKMVPVAPLD